jgi:hypothetical protein
MNRITASCRISDHSVYRNGQLLFENKKTDLSKKVDLHENTDLPGFLLSGYHHFKLNYPKFYKMDNLSKLGWLAAEVLLKEDFRPGTYQPQEVGLSLANANSSLDTDLKYYETVREIPSPALFVYTLPNIMIGEICIRHNFKGESAFYISPRFDAGFMENTVNYLLDNDILKACIGGWVDLLGDEYKAVLYLVEKDGASAAQGSGEHGDAGGLPFTTTTINQLFQSENG